MASRPSQQLPRAAITCTLPSAGSRAIGVPEPPTLSLECAMEVPVMSPSREMGGGGGTGELEQQRGRRRRRRREEDMSGDDEPQSRNSGADPCDFARVLSQSALVERREARERLRRESRKLGRFRWGLSGGGSDSSVQWEGGAEAEELEMLRMRISDQKQQVERIRKTLNRRVRQNEAGQPLSPEEIEEEIWEQRELCTLKLLTMQREEAELKDREQRLHVDRVEHQRRLRIIETEDQVSFGNFSLTQGRYQRLRLIGRNGATEVYRAYDIIGLQHCVVKIHKFSPGSRDADHEERLEAVAQECGIFKQLKHPVLAPLLDHFVCEDGDAFVTVWELCEGDSLELYLLRNGPMPEKEARGVVLQLLSVLRSGECKGHHFANQDIKPGRLAFRGGEVKITSACLPQLNRVCRTMRSGSTLSVSEDDALGGASSGAPGVVWTVGMILHEMLFGRRPEPKSALGGETGTVEIPEQPKVSAECREYLTRLLDRDNQPTLQEAYNDPFIIQGRKR